MPFSFLKEEDDLEILGFPVFSVSKANRIKWTWLSVIYSMQGMTSFWISVSFSSLCRRGKYNWHCILSTLYLAGLDDSAGIWWSVVSQWFLSYGFKFQAICQRLVNLADHRSLVSLQNRVISRSLLRVQNLADQFSAGHNLSLFQTLYLPFNLPRTNMKLVNLVATF